MDLGFDLTKLEGFEWDEGNLEHIKKHNVNSKECEEVFLNKPLIITEDEAHSQKEVRFRVYGQTNKGRLLMMIFTVRNKKIRVISARNQNKKERKEFREKEGEYI